jgi:hypothetical protein
MEMQKGGKLQLEVHALLHNYNHIQKQLVNNGLEVNKQISLLSHI